MGITNNGINDLYEAINTLERQLAELRKGIENGTLSDGYHSFNDLYHQRAYLFATICNQNSWRSWKSKKHSDGSMFGDDWFIVGIFTPKGQYTYHYKMEYWDLFNVQYFENAPEWDGHTDKDVDRLLSLSEVWDGFDPVSRVPEDKAHVLALTEDGFKFAYHHDGRWSVNERICWVWVSDGFVKRWWHLPEAEE